MGQCSGKPIQVAGDDPPRRKHRRRPPTPPSATPVPTQSPADAWPSPCPQSPLPAGVSPSPAKSTPGRFFRRPFISPSPAKHIKAALRKGWRGQGKPNERPIPENAVEEAVLDKSFGFRRNFGATYEVGKEVGRGHFGNTRVARVKKGEMKGQHVAVKIISKAKMTTAISIEDVRREVRILKALSGHPNLIRFYDAYEDAVSVYIVMELCEGGELLDRILSRGGRYPEEEAKAIVRQMLTVVAFCHLQGVVHRDLKPENFLFKTKEESAAMKLIDFGLSDFARLDERLNDIVGSAYYVAPEVLHRSYSMEADIWSVGVITYIMLCGSRPFWSKTESGIFRSVLRAEPNLEDPPWPAMSLEARDFVKRLLSKDYRKRLTAVQALTHSWLIVDQCPVPLDILIFKLVRSYLHSTPFKQAALKALSKALTENELVYIRAQFELLEPNKDGCVRLENFRKALVQNKSCGMVESRESEILKTLEPLANKSMNFEDFCAAAISPHQLEALDGWEQMVAGAFLNFEREGNRVITVQDLAKEMNLPPVAHSVIQVWIRHDDCKLSFVGYTKLLHGVTLRRTSDARHR